METKLLFIKNFIFNYKEVWAILPSSNFLARKMVFKKDIENSNTIIELWAWTWVFTKQILSQNLEWKKVFIIEKDKKFYNLLIKKYPEYKKFIYNYNLLDLEELLEKNNIKNIDLLISWLPFKSLPKEILDFTLNNLIKKYFTKNSIFIQFSYFKTFKDIFNKYFDKVNIKKCWLNIPSAYIYRCKNFK